ncbi:MAG: hypothetical protein IPL10_07160 [Bacteroidetes bacterium]|nr:hypothetical protein [Bacteroidota bacterium]
MTIIYKFETDQFGISDTGIHLLRSGYNYETIEFSNMDELSILKGRQISNWALALMFGLLLVSVGLYVLYHVLYEYFIGNRIHIFHVEQFAFPVIPLIIGTYTIFVALKNGLVLKALIGNKTLNFPIDKLSKQSQIDEFIVFLNTNNLTKHKFKTLKI